MIKLLIDKGAEVNTKDKNKRTPLDFTSGDLTFGVPLISMEDQGNLKTYLRNYGAKTGEELKAEGK